MEKSHFVMRDLGPILSAVCFAEAHFLCFGNKQRSKLHTCYCVMFILKIVECGMKHQIEVDVLATVLSLTVFQTGPLSITYRTKVSLKFPYDIQAI